MLGVKVTEAPTLVPAELVLDYPIKMGGTIDENPFDRIIPEIHRTMPPIFYALDAYPGGTPAWIVRRVEDLQAIYYDTDNFSNKDFAPFALLVEETWSSLPAETDPPMHGLYRKFVNPIFTPTKINLLDDNIRQYAREYCGAIKARGSCEFMADFAFEFPIKVFLELMDLRLEWEMGLLHTNDLAVIAASTRKFVDYLRGEIADRKANPGDDLIIYGVTSQIDGRALTDDELVGCTFNLFNGGMDTVSTNMAWQFRHLAEHPEHQNALRGNPAHLQQWTSAGDASPSPPDNRARAYELLLQDGHWLQSGDFKAVFADNEAVAADTLARNVPLQGAYMIIAARALGLDAGPMSRFDAAMVDAEFFPDARWQANFIYNLGYGEPSALPPRNPRLDFDEACRIV